MLIIELLDDQIRRVWMNGSYCLFGRFFITFFSTYMRREVTVVLDFIKDDKDKIVNITVRQSRQSGVARATCPD